MNRNFKNAEYFEGLIAGWSLTPPEGFETLLPTLSLMGFSCEDFEFSHDEFPSLGITLLERSHLDIYIQVFYAAELGAGDPHSEMPEPLVGYVVAESLLTDDINDYDFTQFDEPADVLEHIIKAMDKFKSLYPDEPKTVKAVPNCIDDFDEWFNAAKFVDVSELDKTEHGGFAYGKSFPVGDSASEETGALVGMWLFPDGLHIVEFEEAFHAPFFDDVIERNRLYHPVISEKSLYDAIHWKSERAVRLMHTYNSRMLMFCAIELYYATYPDDLQARTGRPRGHRFFERTFAPTRENL